MKEKALITTVQHAVYQLFVELGAESAGRERHGFAPLEDGTSVRHGQRRGLAPYRTDVGCGTSIETNTLVEDASTHGIAHHIFVVTGSQSVLLFELFS